MWAIEWYLQILNTWLQFWLGRPAGLAGDNEGAKPMSEPALANVAASPASQHGAKLKDLYEVGEIPPLGHVPKNMYAWAIRRERHGPPDQAMQIEVVPTWQLDSHDVLVLVMAAGVNYNGVWAALGQPISPFDGHKAPYHIAGSDAAGIVWAVGSKVKRWKVGDEVVVHCNQDDGDDEECNGGDPMFSPSQRIWGYETPDGSFAQFTRVQDRQLMARPRHLTWEESACYTLTLATAYRMLFGHRPHVLRPGHNVLVWGASGGLGSFAVQLCATSGANAIGIVSDDDRRDFVMQLGARRDQPQELQLLGPTAESRHAGISGLVQGGAQIRRGHMGDHRARATTLISCSSIRAKPRFRSPCSS
jgi:NADPH:quinone reductase and related Zn-dependent oxidoreductases